MTSCDDGARIVVKMRIRARRGTIARIRTALLSLGDFVMMRKQLSTLKALAERQFEIDKARQKRASRIYD